jgi:hypothetical protein
MGLIGRSRYSYGDYETEVRITRDQLYDLAWSAPMRSLAADLGISDVGLAKALRQQGIPLPDRGYWAKLRAGKAARRAPPPPRLPGQDRLVRVHGTLAERFRQQQPADDDPEGPFASAVVPEDLEELRRMLLKQIGKLVVQRKPAPLHRALLSLIRRDERRRAKIANSSWPDYEQAPIYDAPDQKRRLVLASTMMLALERKGHACELYGAPEPSFSARIGDHHVQVRIQRPGEAAPAHRYHKNTIPPVPSAPIEIDLPVTLPPTLQRSWKDGTPRLEERLGEIVATVITAGEARARLSIAERLEHIARMRAWHAERRREEEAERNAKRLSALYRSGEMLRSANDLRALILGVRTAIAEGQLSVAPEDMAEWEHWAGAEANRLDPVFNGQIVEHLKVICPTPGQADDR